MSVVHCVVTSEELSRNGDYESKYALSQPGEWADFGHSGTEKSDLTATSLDLPPYGHTYSGKESKL